MIRFYEEPGALIVRHKNETLRLEGWGQDALRVRSTILPKFPENPHALTEEVKHTAETKVEGEKAEIVNGSIRATVNEVGVVCFYKKAAEDWKLILQEYYSFYGGSIRKESICFKILSREYQGIGSDTFRLTARFESDPEEKLFGMGQYQQPFLNLRGCVLPLEQRNSQVSVPFLVSDKGYGMLWNNPATGEVSFANNLTK